METQLRNTVIRAPVTGTILERVVERGEFVTTSFVGERGAKGYVVSLADLNDLRVELDISQNDFGRLGPKQKGTITVDAYPGRQMAGAPSTKISPEANRQKATVQVKVKVLDPDEYLRPEMNASVAFLSEEKAARSGDRGQGRWCICAGRERCATIKVFVVVGEKVVERAIRTSGNTPQGLRVEDGLIGGEDLVVDPPAELKSDGAKVQPEAGRSSDDERRRDSDQQADEGVCARRVPRRVALKDADVEIRRGEFVALMGPSGSGKSTLLHLVAAMDRPTSGHIEGARARTSNSLSDGAIAKWRNRHVGFVFQSFNLIPVLTALENVELPLKLTHLKRGERMQHAATALKLVGLGDRLGHFPAPAFRRAGAARGDCARHRDGSRHPALRRADGQPGRPLGGGGAGVAVAVEYASSARRW